MVSFIFISKNRDLFLKFKFICKDYVSVSGTSIYVVNYLALTEFTHPLIRYSFYPPENVRQLES